jgi:Tol biopolymer transport system component
MSLISAKDPSTTVLRSADVRLGVLAIVMVTGCFTKPSRPGTPMPDAGPCTLSDWMGPTTIPLGGFDYASDAATSPWLSDNRDDLWFTRLVGGSAAAATIMHADAGATTTMVDLGASVGDDNPFLSDDGLTLYFDSTRTGTRLLYAANRTSPTGVFPMISAYSGIGQAEEPAVSPDGTILYYAMNAASLYVTMRASISDAFGPGVVMSSGTGLPPIESPSISSDLHTIYFSHHGGEGLRIYQASIAPDGMTLYEIQVVGTFQIIDPAVNYFDPSISRDGKTLAFSSNYEGTAHARLYYVSRDCM